MVVRRRVRFLTLPRVLVGRRAVPLEVSLENHPVIQGPFIASFVGLSVAIALFPAALRFDSAFATARSQTDPRLPGKFGGISN